MPTRLASTSGQQPHQNGEEQPRTRRRQARWPIRVILLVAIVALCCSLNLLPDRRALFDPKHYHDHIWIRIQISPLATWVSPSFGSFIGHRHIPQWLREPLYGLYVWIFGCQMDEAAQESLRAYPTPAAFFNRNLKEGARPISNSMVVSPADGTVMHFGKVDEGRIEYVKGNDYEVHEFLGPVNTDTADGNALYQVVIYLSPGDYHGFHSPTKWRVMEKIHFPGFYQSVKPANMERNGKLLTQNERIVLSGQWKHGYFSMTAVAAFFVGDIVILNEPVKNRKVHESEQFDIYDERMAFKPGDKVGEFRFGSTVVLIFEAPDNIEFCIEAGKKLRYGQSLIFQPATN